ncbi:MAG TPA: TA system VapC family ribonuclease toxin [Burkholderiaceae bacterium]|nr:TA system VapC family ribonuclease toxin [Burkholderiaceae bacterium]
MIGVDTNLLVYAHRRESTFHDKALEALGTLAASVSAWAIPWPCIHEFYGVVTNARAFKPASTISEASAQVAAWLESPSLVLLHEGANHWAALHRLLVAGRVVGGQVHDARIAAICIEHGVREFWSADRDFNRFPSLTVRNPLVE